MNHLAHIYLSYGHERVMVGNFFCDFLKLKEQRLFPEKYTDGFRLHRWIDSYTDQHAIVAEMRNILRPASGKYAGVICDILMDYQLVKNWNLFGELPFEDYCQNQYATILGFLDLVPESIQSRIQGMIQNQWLHSFSFEEGMETTFRYLSDRAKYWDSFAGVMPLYRLHESKLDGLFMEFFPELCGYVILRMEEFNLQSAD